MCSFSMTDIKISIQTVIYIKIRKLIRTDIITIAVHGNTTLILNL